jgi:hypothetical protein
MLQLNEPGTVTEPQSRGQFATPAGMTAVKNRPAELESAGRYGAARSRSGAGGNFSAALTSHVSGRSRAVAANLWKRRENQRELEISAHLKILFHNSLTTR